MSRTTIRSASRTVVNRCDTITVIVAGPDTPARRYVPSNSASLSGSRLAAGSSRRTRAGRVRIRARASASFCHCPADRSVPSGKVRPSWVSRPRLSPATTSAAPADSRAAHTAASSPRAPTSPSPTVSRASSSNRQKSWKQAVIRADHSCAGIPARSSPPNVIRPADTGCSPASSAISVDLPAPLSPTTATVVPADRVRSTGPSAGSVRPGYVNETPSRTSSPPDSRTWSGRAVSCRAPLPRAWSTSRRYSATVSSERRSQPISQPRPVVAPTSRVLSRRTSTAWPAEPVPSTTAREIR
ncbi:hypothetical protein BG418_33845 [Streptomyces sp. CBMA152]|nr:hypothetical protein [Streptomyces sp. CBMA152]